MPLLPNWCLYMDARKIALGMPNSLPKLTCGFLEISYSKFSLIAGDRVVLVPYLTATLMRTCRALLKVVTTRLLATRDSFAMTMSVMACMSCVHVPQITCNGDCATRRPSQHKSAAVQVASTMACPKRQAECLCTQASALGPKVWGMADLIIDGDRGARVCAQHCVDGVHPLHIPCGKFGPSAGQDVDAVPHHKGPRQKLHKRNLY